MTPEIGDVTTIPVSELLDRVHHMARLKRRFVTATCIDADTDLEILYHFAEADTLSHLRIVVPKGDEVPSISGVYLCAFLVENEMIELFGANITGVAIDYKGRLYLAEGVGPTPMLKPRRGA
jgi:NADH:ubiquinone oxidoreductase subunit C